MPGEEPNTPGSVVPLPAHAGAERAPGRASPPGRLHGLAMAGMALFAVVGILATLAFITVGWPGDTGRRVIAVVVVSAVGFMACASAAILAAARDAYPSRSRPDGAPHEHDGSGL